MRLLIPALFALSLPLAASPANSQAVTPDQFASQLAAAEKNLQMETGAAYDRLLGTTIEQQPDFAPRIDQCVKTHPDAHSVKGYFEFRTAMPYRLVLAPKSPFSDCLTKAIEGRTVPAPPALPYVNPFSFTYRVPTK
jgi:hypothetical protein